MKRLGLRARVLLAVGLVAIAQVAVALVVISLAREQFLDQVDDRLEVAVASLNELDTSGATSTRPGTNPDGRRPLGDIYQGVLRPDGTLETLLAVNAADAELPQPEVSRADAVASLDQPVTIGLDTSELDYRVRSVPTESGDLVVTAIPLDDLEHRVERLTSIIVIGATILIVLLGTVTWWVLRLGVRPLKTMTSSAEAIAEGDLSERVEVPHPGTEAGQLGQALNTMMARIESSFEERSLAEERLRSFMADASHELRTPTATIRGYAELYEAGGLEQQDALDDAMRRMREESQRMSRLISDMLELAKLDRNPEVATSQVQLDALAADVVAAATAIHDGRTVRTDFDDEPVCVIGDEDLLRQALTNLVGNALDHTDPPAMVTVSVTGNGSGAAVRVSDDGPGMSAEERSRATERFYRGDPSRSRSSGGAGLGLAIVESVITAHHGELRLESTPGAGTSVTLTLPTRTTS